MSDNPYKTPDADSAPQRRNWNRFRVACISLVGGVLLNLVLAGIYRSWAGVVCAAVLLAVLVAFIVNREPIRRMEARLHERGRQ